MKLPRIKNCSEFITMHRNRCYILHVETENGACRRNMRVYLPSHIDKLVYESALVPVSRKTESGNPLQSTTVGEAVYAYRLLKKNGLASHYPDLLTQSIEEGRWVLDMAFDMVKFLKTLESA